MPIETMTASQARNTLKDAPLSFGYADTPVGPVTLRFASNKIIGLNFGKILSQTEMPAEAGVYRPLPSQGFRHEEHARAQEEVDAYYNKGAPNAPLLLIGTVFQTTIWKTLAKTSAGETLSYGELARLAGYPRAARAVGQAMNKNPIALFIPCHRVIASDGSLGGFACGLDIKRNLLSFEKAQSSA